MSPRPRSRGCAARAPPVATVAGSLECRSPDSSVPPCALLRVESDVSEAVSTMRGSTPRSPITSPLGGSACPPLDGSAWATLPGSGWATPGGSACPTPVAHYRATADTARLLSAQDRSKSQGDRGADARPAVKRVAAGEGRISPTRLRGEGDVTFGQYARTYREKSSPCGAAPVASAHRTHKRITDGGWPPPVHRGS